MVDRIIQSWRRSCPDLSIGLVSPVVLLCSTRFSRFFSSLFGSLGVSVAARQARRSRRPVLCLGTAAPIILRPAMMIFGVDESSSPAAARPSKRAANADR